MLQDLFIEWKAHPLTVELLETIEADIDNIKESWANGSFLTQPETTNAYTAGMREALDMLKAAIESGEFIVEESNDGIEGSRV